MCKYFTINISDNMPVLDILSYLYMILTRWFQRAYLQTLLFLGHITSRFGARAGSLRIISIKSSDDVFSILQAQIRLNSDEKFVIELPWRTIHVLPRSFLADYGWKKDDKISSNIDLRERILGKWTLLGSLTPMEPGDRTHSAVAFIKDSMTKRMALYFDAVHEEIAFGIDTHIGKCADWRGRSAYHLSVNLNMKIFERVFVGLDLCRNNDWNEACQGYSTSAIHTAATLMGYSWWQQPIVARFLPECKSLNRHIANLQKHLDAILRSRLKDTELQVQKPGRTVNRTDFIDWWIQNVPEDKVADSYALTVALIQLNIAGIQSTAMVLMHALFDLASRTEYTEPLLAELRQVCEEHGSSSLSPKALSKLVKLDSFLKESQRHISQNLLSVYRKVMAPLHLRDGSILPTGSYVAVPSLNSPIEQSTCNFEGFRWAKLASISENPQKLSSVASGTDSLEYGYGVHACPGRFFASNAVKATLAAILLRFELRMPPGETIPTQKYNSILVLVPPKESVVQFRARPVQY